MPPLSTRSKTFLALLVLLASSEFVVRGPLRFLRAADFNDFISPYIQSRALIQGMDPYSPEVLVRLWPVGGRASATISRQGPGRRFIDREARDPDCLSADMSIAADPAGCLTLARRALGLVSSSQPV